MTRCVEPGCITLLSASNPGPKCRAHATLRWRGIHAITPLVNAAELEGRYRADGLQEAARRHEEQRLRRERAS